MYLKQNIPLAKKYVEADELRFAKDEEMKTAQARRMEEQAKRREEERQKRVEEEQRRKELATKEALERSEKLREFTAKWAQEPKPAPRKSLVAAG